MRPDQILLDTNAVLSLLTDRSNEQKNAVLVMAQKALKGEVELILHPHVISETIFTLLNLYRVTKGKVADIVRDLIDHPGVRLENDLSWNEVLEFWPQIFPDVGDAIMAAIARERDYSVFTFDRKFGKKLELVKVIWNNPK